MTTDVILTTKQQWNQDGILHFIKIFVRYGTDLN